MSSFFSALCPAAITVPIPNVLRPVRPVRGMRDATALHLCRPQLRLVPFYKLYSTPNPSLGRGFCRSLHSLRVEPVNVVLYDRLALARQNASKLAFALAYPYSGFAEDTAARQNTSKLAFALAYPYSGFAEDTSPQQNCKQVCFCFRLIRIFAL